MKKNQHELKKHVAAIHSSNKISLVQRKIANALLYNAYHDMMQKDEHQISIKDLCHLTGYHSNDYKTIKLALVGLLATVIEWNLVDKEKIDGEGVWNASSMIADASIDGSVCTYSYSQKMKNLLYSPLVYGRLNMLVQAKFKSNYGLALYENCARYQNIHKTPWFDLVLFRKLMGVEEGKYEIFRDFKRRVIDKAVEEVNHYAPIQVTPEYQRVNRQVVSLRFLIESQSSPHDHPENVEVGEGGNTADLSQRLRDDFGFSKVEVDQLLESYDESYILEKISLVEDSLSFRSGKIINLAKYLEGALKGDYQPPVSSQERLSTKTKIAARKKREQNQQEEMHRLQFVTYRNYQEKTLQKLMNTLPPKENKALYLAFEAYLGTSLYLDIYRRDGLKNILVMDQFISFIQTERASLLSDMLTYDEFCKKKVLV